MRIFLPEPEALNRSAKTLFAPTACDGIIQQVPWLRGPGALSLSSSDLTPLSTAATTKLAQFGVPAVIKERHTSGAQQEFKD